MSEIQQEQLKFIQASLPEEADASQNKQVHQSPFKEQYLREMSNYMSTSRQLLLKQLKNHQIYQQTIKTDNHVVFLKIDCSKSSQVIELHLKVGLFLLKIRIINVEGSSPLHCADSAGSGTFGSIYKYLFLDSTRAVKCFKVNDDKLQESLASIITQYSLLKVASIIKSGPKINLNTFDIFVYKSQVKLSQSVSKQYCIQFHTQYCDPCVSFGQKDKVQLFQSLYSLHAIGITHCDIKPSNVMYSSSLNKWVFIDFGISYPVTETIGQSTLTKYRGTFKYSGSEMKVLYKTIFQTKKQQQQFIDLFWNDVQGLTLTSFDLQSHNKNIVNKQNSQTTKIVSIQQHLLMIDFKYWLYFGSQCSGEYFIQLLQWDKEHQSNIISFLLELKYIPEKITALFVQHLQKWKLGPQLQQFINEAKSSLDYDQHKENRYQQSINRKLTFFKEIPIALQEAQPQDINKDNAALVSKSKQIKDLFQYLKNYSKSQEDEHYYLAMLFTSVNFLKKQIQLSISNKIQLCKQFYQLYPSQYNFTSEIDYIKYFIQSVLKYCFRSKEAVMLKQYLPQIYSNYLMLGLNDLQVAQAMHQTIFATTSNKTLICQYFLQIYNSYFWWEQQISQQYTQGMFTIKNEILCLMYKIVESLGWEKDPIHLHCNQPFCMDMQAFMLERIEKQAGLVISNYRFEYSQFEQKIERCLRVLKSFRTSIKRKDHIRIHLNKVISQIPMNLKQFFIPQYYILNPQSWSRISFFIEKFIQSEQISNNWAFILKMKLYYLFFKAFEQSEVESLLTNHKKNIKYMQTYYEAFMQLIYSEQKTMREFQQYREQFIDKYSQAFFNVGNLFAPDELACLLANLSQKECSGVWYYLEVIFKSNPEKVMTTLNLFYTRISGQRCLVKKEYKLLKLSELVCRKSMSVDKLKVYSQVEITEYKQQREFLEIKLKHYEQIIISLVKAGKSSQQYLIKFYQTVLRNNRYNDFMLKNTIYIVYEQLISLLLRSSKVSQAIKLIFNLSSHLTYLLSKQTSILNKKIKCLIYNLFVFNTQQYFTNWQSFRDEFVLRSLQNKDKISIFYNLTIVLIEHRYYELANTQTPTIKGCNFLGYWQVQRMLFQFAQVLTFRIPVFQTHEIENYYRAFNYLFSFHPSSLICPRYKVYVLRKHRDAIIKNLPLVDSHKTFYCKYLHQNQYVYKILIRRLKKRQRFIQKIVVNLFKEKIDKIIWAYKGGVLKKVKIIP